MIATVFITLQYGRIRHERHWHYRRISPSTTAPYQIANILKNLHADPYRCRHKRRLCTARREPPFWTNTPVPAWRSPRVRMSSELRISLVHRFRRGFATPESLPLEKTGCKRICFGADAYPCPPCRIADVLADEPTDLKASLKYNLKSGSTFPKAREAALLSYFSGSAGQDGALPVSAEALSSLLASPNNILALEYLKALRRRASSITPYLLKREGAAYHETSILSGASAIPASASAIRHTLFADAAGACGNSAAGILLHAMPQEALSILQDYRADFPLLCADDFSGILGYLLLSSSATQLARTADSSPEFTSRMQNQLPSIPLFPPSRHG